MVMTGPTLPNPGPALLREVAAPPGVVINSSPRAASTTVPIMKESRSKMENPRTF